MTIFSSFFVKETLCRILLFYLFLLVFYNCLIHCSFKWGLMWYYATSMGVLSRDENDPVYARARVEPEWVGPVEGLPRLNQWKKKNQTQVESNPSCNPSISTRAQPTGFSSCLGSTPVELVLRSGWASYPKLFKEQTNWRPLE